MEREMESSELEVLPEEQVEHVIGAGYFSNDELDAFYQLISNRRSLPVYADGIWCCYECDFHCPSLATMVEHILRLHSQAPVKNQKDERLEDRWFRQGTAL